MAWLAEFHVSDAPLHVPVGMTVLAARSLADSMLVAEEIRIVLEGVDRNAEVGNLYQMLSYPFDRHLKLHTWEPRKYYQPSDVVIPTANELKKTLDPAFNCCFHCIRQGISGNSEPAWVHVPGEIINEDLDGEVPAGSRPGVACWSDVGVNESCRDSISAARWKAAFIPVRGETWEYRRKICISQNLSVLIAAEFDPDEKGWRKTGDLASDMIINIARYRDWRFGSWTYWTREAFPFISGFCWIEPSDPIADSVVKLAKIQLSDG